MELPKTYTLTYLLNLPMYRPIGSLNMKKLLTLTLLILSSATIGWALHVTYAEQGRIQITKLTTDERGLISIQFVQDGHSEALDYLTQAEFNALDK